MHKQIDVLMQREMTRKEFMATLGIGAATLMGFGSIMRLFKPSTASSSSQSKGYGSSSYGG